jgi:predicted hydrocarbon binding protein
MKIKGATLEMTVSFIKQAFGEDQFAQVTAVLEIADREVLSGKIHASKWYPFRLYERILTAMDNVLGDGDGSLCYKCGRYDAEYDLNSLYKLFYKKGSPQFIISNAMFVWRTFFDSGRVEVENVGDKTACFRVLGADEYASVVCREIEGWLEKTTELSGGRNATVEETKCRVKGDEFCEYVIKWE